MALNADFIFTKLILNEFMNVTRCHRKAAIRVLTAHATPRAQWPHLKECTTKLGKRLWSCSGRTQTVLRKAAVASAAAVATGHRGIGKRRRSFEPSY